MNRLIQIGFRTAGHWHIDNGQLAFDLDDHRKLRNILYAFVSGSDVKYIGKTLQALGTRLIGYRTPGKDQSTNRRNNAAIRALLTAGKSVDILALPDNGMLHYGQFHLNIAAGLEDSLIAVIEPEWNGGKRSDLTEEVIETPALATQPTDRFSLVLEPTYYKHGFFNVRALHAKSFGAHGQVIEIFCGGDTEPVLGTINRTATSNGSPRIMGGRHVRDWFQQHFAVRDSIDVEVTSQTSIRLLKRPPP